MLGCPRVLTIEREYVVRNILQVHEVNEVVIFGLWVGYFTTKSSLSYEVMP